MNASLPTIGPVIEVSSNSNSEKCFQIAASWLDTCVHDHIDCQDTASKPLPTRVIDVCLDGTREPFLLETSGQHDKYIALSYCWGDPNTETFLKTTAETLKDHKREIPFATFPKTLQDAVTITRRLKIPYLWIDALCIIQGDADDWAREAGKMCEVYSFAHLTVAMSSSPGSSSGCFRAQSFGSNTLKLSYKGMPVYVRKQLARDHNRSLIMLQGSIEEHVDPIRLRAWTLQENILSNRVLHFTSNELVWECNSWFGCECQYANEAIEDGDEISSRIVRRPKLEKEKTLQQLYAKWNEILSLFTERLLTVEEDRLPALSGLAKQFSFVLEEKAGKEIAYISGLWEGNFSEGLLWSTEDDFYLSSRDKKFKYRRPGKWRAPSWSWAAIEGPAIFRPLPKFQSRVKLLDWSVKARTLLDPFGQLTAGHVVLQGTIVHQIAICEDKDRSGSKESGTAGFANGKRYCVQEEDTVYVVQCDDIGSVLTDQKIYSCFLVGVIDWWGEFQRFFLVLKPSTLVIGAWERVGVSCLMVGINPFKRKCPLFDGTSAAEEIITLV